jgi:hypothetical protein
MNEIGRKWLAKDLYEVCPICEGIGRIEPDKFRGLGHPPDADGLVTCPNCEGYKLTPTGYTVREVERLRARVDLLTARAERAEAELARTRDHR